MKARHLPNIITSLRLVLIAPFLHALFNDNYQIAFYLFIIAGLSDGIDGWLARSFHWQSHLGGLLDPLADKLFVACSYFSLAYLNQLPWWLVILVFSRDVVISIGVLLWQKLFGHIEFKPTYLSKFNTVIQGLVVLMVLYQLSFMPIPSWLVSLMLVIITTTTSASFIQYVWVWGRKAYHRLKQRTNAVNS